MTDTDLSSAIQELRDHCNEVIKMANSVGASNVPGFRSINTLLMKCDAVFRASDKAAALSAGVGGAEKRCRCVGCLYGGKCVGRRDGAG